jgi:hemerythrin superfamily protein
MTVDEDVDVLALLGRQHKLIGALFNKVEMTQGQQRRTAFERLVRVLAVHETIEEEIVHPALRQAADGAGTVETLLEEEREGKELLAELDRVGPDADGFDARLRELHHIVLRHAAHEEREEFPVLRATLTPARLRSMGVSARSAELVAPTHPHPGVEGAAANVLGGPFVAIADRVRDAVRKATQGSTTGTEGSTGQD